MDKALLRWALALALSCPPPSFADVARCTRPQDLDPTAPIVVDISRVIGTDQRPEATRRSRIRVEVVLSAPVVLDFARDVRVELVDASGQVFATKVEPRGSGVARSASVSPGTYVVRASVVGGSPELQRTLFSPPQRVVLNRDVNEIHVQFGKTGQAFFRMGKGLVPFTPSPYIAVVAPSSAQLERLIPVIDDTLTPLRASHLEESKGVGKARRGSVLLIQSDKGAYQPEVAEALRRRTGNATRVGMAIDLDAGSLRVLDNRYVLRFSPRADDALRARVLSGNGLAVQRRYRHDADLVLADFGNESYGLNLATINCLVEEGVLTTGEPDIVQRWETSGAMPDGWPHDPRYPSQEAKHASHDDQKIREAWRLLFDSERNLVAQSSVRVGLIDHLIDPDDEELACMVDGSSQVAMCWDPVRLAAGSDGHCSGPVPAQDIHGMHMLGIIAACTDNEKGVAGISPGVRINALAFANPGNTDYFAGDEYSSRLLWMGGESEPCTGSESQMHPCRWPAVGSDVINNSYTTGTPAGWHGQNIELPELIGYAFQTLVDYGRGGKGTVLVYAAGNWPHQSFATNVIAPTAADSRTIGVSNCFYDRKDEKERLYRGETGNDWSNIGDKIDVCARGEGAETIPAGCPGFDASTGCPSAGTSAAAATVTGIVALMLSANPDLTSQDVQRILRDTADKIDFGQTEPDGQWLNGRSRWYGAGRVNAEAAVKAAIAARCSGDCQGALP